MSADSLPFGQMRVACVGRRQRKKEEYMVPSIEWPDRFHTESVCFVFPSALGGGAGDNIFNSFKTESIWSMNMEFCASLSMIQNSREIDL